jgi:serine/threonine protein kinase
MPRIVQKIEVGSGSFGKVYKAIDDKGNVWALKVSTADIAAAQSEILPLLILGQHDNICSLQGYGPNWMVLDYCHSDLSSVIIQEPQKPLMHIVNYMKQILRGLCHIHKYGFVHRDLKPDNILVTHSGVLKIADFGMALRMSSKEKPLGGTVNYMPPEFLECSGRGIGELNYGYEVDIWSVGVILYFMMTHGQTFGFNGNVAEFLKRVKAIRGRIGNGSYRNDRFREYLKSLVDPPVPRVVLKPTAAPVIPKDCECLIPLLLAMLDWDPIMRPTAKEALMYLMGQKIHVPEESYLLSGPSGPALVRDRFRVLDGETDKIVKLMQESSDDSDVERPLTLTAETHQGHAISP